MTFYKKTNDSKVLIKIQFFLVLILLSSTSIFGQKARTDTFYVVELQKQDIKQVVKSILIYYFRPTTKPKVIYLSQENIQRGWLPSIKNIEFQLLKADEIEQKKIDVYFFGEVWQNTPGLYEVIFAYGNPRCENSGDLWNFRVSNRKVKLWRKQNGEVEGECYRDPLLLKKN